MDVSARRLAIVRGGTLRRSVVKQSLSRRTLAKRPRRFVRKIGRSRHLSIEKSDQFMPPVTTVVARVTDLPEHDDAQFITPRFSAKTTVSDEVAHCAFTMVFSDRPHAETLRFTSAGSQRLPARAHSV